MSRLNLLAAAFAALSSAVSATTINVASSSGGSNDGTGCTLRDAVQAVNTRAVVGQCPAAAGPTDTINIQADLIFFSGRDTHSTNAALPAVAAGRYLNIYGKPGINTVLEQSGCLLSSLNGVTDTHEFRLLEVQSGAAVYVQDVEFSHGCADGPADSVTDTSSDNARGGAISNSGTLYLVHSRLTQNVAKGWGGAIYNAVDAQLAISSTDFETNSSVGGGGAVFVDSEDDPYDAEVSASLFNHNSAYGGQYASALGGAIRSRGTLVVTNSTFNENSGDGGGGIFSTGFLGLSFSTFQNAGTPGSTLGFGQNSTSYVKSSLFGPTPYPIYKNCYYATGASVSWYGVSVSVDDSCGGGANLANTSPGLDTVLADNGGPTHTLKLLPGSPAIGADAGCTDVYGDPVAIDQRGFPRPASRCDAGAFEADLIFANGF